MKKLLLGVLLLPTLVFSEPVKIDKEVICDETKVVIATLIKFKEVLVWTGKDDTSRYALLANEKTGSWTIIQFNEDLACIIGVGDSHKPLKLDSKNTVRSKLL